MITFDYKLKDPHGLHARPAGELAKRANHFDCDITFYKDSHSANVKSVLNLMALALKEADTVTVICSGEDEEKASECIREYMKNNI